MLSPTHKNEKGLEDIETEHGTLKSGFINPLTSNFKGGKNEIEDQSDI